MRVLDRLLPLLLFLFALVIRLAHYTTADISMDEPFTLFHCQKSFADLMGLFMHENNPPLYFVVMNLWIKAFGIEPESVRLVPVLFSSLTAPALYLLGKSHFTRTNGLLLAVVFTFTDLHQYYAHDVRAYSLFVLLTVLSMHQFLKMAERSRLTDLFLLGLLNSLLIYNHYLGFWVLVVQGFALLVIKEYRQLMFWRYVLSSVVTIVTFGPFIYVLLSRVGASGGSGWLASPTISSIYNVLWSFSNQPILAVVGIVTWVTIPMWLLLIKGFKLQPQEKLLVVWFLLPLFAMFLVSQWIPMFLDRYLIFAFPAYVFGVLVWLEKVEYFRPLSLIFALGFIFTFNIKSGHRSQIKALVHQVKADINPQRPLFISPTWNKLQVAYHFDRDVFSDHKNLDQRLHATHIYPFHDGHFIQDGKAPSTPSVVYLDPDRAGSPMTSSTIAALNQRYSSVRVDDRFFPFRLHYFSEPK